MGLKKVRIAFLGAGRVAKHYALILRSMRSKNFEIVAVCDVNKVAREGLAKEFSCASVESVEKLIEISKIDLVFVLTPSGLHFGHAKKILSAGVSVLVEKPPTMRPSEASELRRLAEVGNLMLGVVFQNRLNPAVKRVKAAIDEGRFGRIVTSTVRLRWCRYQEYYEDGWHGTWSQDGGVINQQAIHHVDALSWLSGPVSSVCSVATRRLNRLEAEDTMVCALEFTSGALGTIEATTAARPVDREASFSIIGEQGAAVIGGVALNKIETWDFVDMRPEDVDVPLQYSQAVPNGYGLSHGPLLEETFQRLSNGLTHPVISIQDCLQTLNLVHAIYASSEIKGWVSLSNNPLSSRLGIQEQHSGK
jgi:UDP-N-acetyl-2-amino-2-deoxyglucuronate dehydrogenase